MPKATGRTTKAATPRKTVSSGAKAAVKSTAARGAAPAAKSRATVAKTPASAATRKAPAAAKTASRTAKQAPARTATKSTAKATPRKAPAKATTAARAKAPARRRGAPLDKFLEGQRAALLERRATYTHQAESLRAEADLLAAEREPGDVQFDEESGVGDTLAVERERDLALSAQAIDIIEDIDKALEKITLGTYGVCAQCGDPIPKERLRAIPYAALCVRCKSGGLGRR